MVIHYYGLCQLNRNTEMEFRRVSKSKYIIGNHFSGLANEAAKYNLDVVLVYSEVEMFKFD